MISTKTKRTKPRKPDDAYLDLVNRFPLWPIRDSAEYHDAAKILDALAVRDEGSLRRGEQDYLDTLTLLVQDFDGRHFRMETQDLDGLDMLKYLMEQREMKTVDLGRILGNRALASLILNGHRSLSKSHMRILGEYFHVDPGLFLLAK